MCVDFLNNSMRGTTHLKGVLDTCYTARRAAGIPDPFNITFEEYVERLIQAAQPHDATLGQNRGRGSEVPISTPSSVMRVMRKKTPTTKTTLKPL